MRHISEVLLLKHEAGPSYARIAGACGLPKGVVGKYVSLAQAQGIGWPLPDHVDEARLEALLFKTLKYRSLHRLRPFENVIQTHQWTAGLVTSYNHDHRHSAIRFVTPAQHHAEQDTAILEQRKTVYALAKARRPEHWSGPTRDWTPVGIVLLNPETTAEKFTNRI